MDPRVPLARVRIKNIKSGRYLSIKGNNWEREGDNSWLSIRDWQGKPVPESPQVWNIIMYREGAWILLNQYNMLAASIYARSKGINQPVVQYRIQNETLNNEPFQLWIFEPHPNNGNWYIQNFNSKMYIGPENRATDEDHYCIQYDKQTDDSYQQWQFEAI